MSEAQPITLEWIDEQLEKVRNRPGRDHKHDISVGDLLLVRKGLVEEREAGKVIYAAGVEAPRDIIF